MNTVTLHVTHSVLPLPVITGSQPQTVPSIMTRPRVVTFRIAPTVADLTDLAVTEDESLSERAVLDHVDADIQGDVVRAEGFD